MMTRLRQAVARFLFAAGRRVNVPRQETFTVTFTADASAFTAGMKDAAELMRTFAPRADEITDGIPLDDYPCLDGR